MTGLGGRITIGAGFERGALFGNMGVVACMIPNLLEFVVDGFGGGPIPRTARFGIALGWEF